VIKGFFFQNIKKDFSATNREIRGTIAGQDGLWSYKSHPNLNVLAIMQHPQREDKSDYRRLSKAPAIGLSACTS